MKKIQFIIVTLCLFSFAVTQAPAAGDRSTETQPVSGALVGGFRVLPIQKTQEAIHLKVYRGDYVKFDFDASVGDPVLAIPHLAVTQRLPDDVNAAPYFKMQTTGTFAFALGEVNGDITVIDYAQPHYREVSSKEAAQIINDRRPLILDVRTPGEYARGHLKDAVLIPVQELQGRLQELSAYKNEDILLYCATGNRSTVASKILIDNGFKRISNLRQGIYDWSRNQYPVTR
ncbi:MAG: rhodanese-like domain-containing protein [Desulfobacterales bacterium]|nr:MAG: rhodanese-like domain-containing protein [Desulfobacterales bacterium]